MEWVVDALGCDSASLRNPARLGLIFQKIIDSLGLRPVGDPVWHRFPAPGGVTGLWLLSESHLCCHTFPETGYAAFNLYCCRPRPELDWQAALAAELGATSVSVRRLPRGGLVAGE